MDILLNSYIYGERKIDMKKRSIVAISLILLLAVVMTLFVGCDEIFKRNDERDMTQVVATVKYEGLTDYVYKFELASSFNNYAYYYVNYYGMTYEAAANYVAQSLAQQRLPRSKWQICCTSTSRKTC